MSSFKDLRIVDNFYQTSAFFPMPTVIISTLADDGQTNCGAYSLVQPYYIAGKDYYAFHRTGDVCDYRVHILLFVRERGSRIVCLPCVHANYSCDPDLCENAKPLVREP